MSRKSVPKKKARKATSRPRAAHKVTSEGALQFIRKMQKAFPKAPRTKEDKERLRKYLAKFRDKVLKAVGERLQTDLMQRPPVTIRRKDYKKPRPSGSVSREKQA